MPTTGFDPALKLKLLKLTGAHRVKRVPPTEKKGRKHTSTIMVVAGETAVTAARAIPKHEVKEEFYRASGRGGQHRNKVETAVRLTHGPTGIVAQATEERSQAKNRAKALARLEQKVFQARASAEQQSAAKTKANQFILDEAWTWTDYRDEVKTPTGARGSMAKALRGDLAKLLA